MDETDTFNQGLDLLHGQPLTLQLAPVPTQAVQAFTVQGSTLPGSEVQLEGEGQVLPIELQEDGHFALPLSLPDGPHQYTVRSSRNNSEYALAQTVVLDRTPPEVVRLNVSRTGRLLNLDLAVQDQTQVKVQVLNQVLFYDGSVLHLPIPQDGQGFPLVLQDQAGNTSTVQVEVPAP